MLPSKFKASFDLNESVEPMNADRHRTRAIEIMFT